MQTNTTIKFISKMSGFALIAFQMMTNTACADYRGYWMDTVQKYQGNDMAYQDYSRTYKAYRPAPEYRNTQYQPAYAYHDNYAPAPASRHFETGRASYYADKYQGHRTASGETYNKYDMTAAHPSLPFGTPIRVTNVENGRSVVVRVNDRGPFKPGRVVDVSYTAAQQLGLILNGTATVQVDVLG